MTSVPADKDRAALAALRAGLPPRAEPNAPLPAIAADPHLLSVLALRRSTKVTELAEPGPDADTLRAILDLAARVPDHGKLAPWRFIILEGAGAQAYGAALADLLRIRTPDTAADILDAERLRFRRAPVCVAVVSSSRPSAKVPDWEQFLSAGAVCHNLMLAARGFGFGACWLTGWAACDRAALDRLGLAADETLAGFIHLGTPTTPPLERPRPNIDTLVTRWSPEA